MELVIPSVIVPIYYGIPFNLQLFTDILQIMLLLKKFTQRENKKRIEHSGQKTSREETTWDT
jgi:hypothetical protein